MYSALLAGLGNPRPDALAEDLSFEPGENRQHPGHRPARWSRPWHLNGFGAYSSFPFHCYSRAYLSEPPLRSRIRRDLLKVEQLHALARDVYYGRRGRINVRELHKQMNSHSCLTLILACVIYWQAKEISRVVRWCQPENAEDKIDIALLEHISTIKINNVILYGQYVLDRSQVC
jgi:hypothetical protein